MQALLKYPNLVVSVVISTCTAVAAAVITPSVPKNWLLYDSMHFLFLNAEKF